VADPTSTPPELTWTDSPTLGATYDVYRGLGTPCTPSMLIASGLLTGVLPFTDVTATPDTRPCYDVTAVDAASEGSDPSNTVSVHYDTAAPDPPSGLTVPAATNLPPALSWAPSDSEDVIGYDVLSGSPDCSSLSLIGTVDASTTTYTDTAAAADAATCYVVRADDGVQDSTDSNQASTVYDTQVPSGSLTAPSEGAVVSGSAVTVASTDAADTGGSGLLGVELDESGSGTGDWHPIGTATAAPWSLAWDTTAVADGDYDLRAVIDDAAGNSFTTPTVTVTVHNAGPPDPPTALVVPAATNTAPALSWTASDTGSVTAYHVERGSPDCSSLARVATVPAATTSYTDSTAAANAAYCYTVRAFDGVDESSDSNQATTAFDTRAPTGSVTAPLAGATVSGASVTVASADAADTGGSGLLSVEFDESVSGAGDWQPVGTATAAPWSVAWDTTALLDGAYDLRAVLTDAAGNSFTTPVVAAVQTANAPDPPTGLTVPAATDAAPALSWTASDSGSVSTYEIQRGSPGCGSLAPLDSVPAGSTSYVDDAAAPNASYCYAVRASDGVNESVDSNHATTVFDTEPPTGSITAPLAAAVVAGPAVTVASGDAADTGGSHLASVTFQESPAGAGSWSAVGTATAPPWSVAWDTTGVADGGYDLRALIEDAAGNEVTTAVVSVTVHNARAPDAPSGLSVPAATNAAPVLSWTASDSPGVLEYRVRRGSPTCAGAAQVAAVPAPSTGYTDTSAAANHTYCYVVRAWDGFAESADSAQVVTHFDSHAPTGSLTSPAGGSVVSGSVTLASADAADTGGSGLATVSFQASVAGAGSWSTIGVASSAPWSVQWDTTTAADISYDLRAVLTDRAGNSVTSSVVTVTVHNAGAPDPPSGLSVAPATNAAPSLAWVASDSGSVTQYHVERGSPDCSSLAQVGVVGAHATAFVDSTAAPNHAYCYTVRAFDGFLESPDSNQASTAFDTRVPTGSVTAPAASSVVSGGVTLASGDAADTGGSHLASVRFQVAPSGSGSWSTVGTATSAPWSVPWATTAADDGVYDVRAVLDDHAGNETTSAAVAGVDVRNVPLAPPTGVAVPAATDAPPLLSWSASPSAEVSAYRVYRGSPGCGSAALLTSVAASATGFEDDSAAPNKAYCYLVSSFDGVAESPRGA
jgi:fibronectin type 3 domain-containing protein